MNKTTDNKELGFVLHHYRQNVFNPDKALRKLAKPAPHRPLRHWVAAAASLLCVVAFATVITWGIHHLGSSAETEPSSQGKAQTEVAAPHIVTFHFDDTPLSEVLRQLSSHYGVQLTAADIDKHLTGDFAADSLDVIIGMIEEVLDVEIVAN